MKSIRRFLIVVLIAAITLIIFVAALHGYRTSLTSAEQLMDEQLIKLVDVLAPVVEQSTNKDIALKTESLIYQVWRNEQLVVENSFGIDEPLAPFVTGFHDINLNKSRWRVYAKSYSGNEDWIFVGERIDSRFMLVESVIIESIVPIILSLPIISLLIWFIVGRGLKPLNILATQLSKKNPSDLLPIGNLSDTEELTQLVSSINQLFVRLSSAIEREKRFSANAAHELRTPISVLKVQLYNLQKELRENSEKFMPLARGVDRLQHVVEQVLALYLTEQDKNLANFKEVDLLLLCRQVISDSYESLIQRDQDIELVGESVSCEGNAQMLMTLLTNLIANAGKYSPFGSQIKVIVSDEGKCAVIAVEDSGPGIAAEERQQVFERFYRVGGDRHGSGVQGCGLGLSIVKQIVDFHGGSITLDESNDLGGLRVVVKMDKIRR